jgi:hypothetical protein
VSAQRIPTADLGFLDRNELYKEENKSNQLIRTLFLFMQHLIRVTIYRVAEQSVMKNMMYCRVSRRRIEKNYIMRRAIIFCLC